MQVRLSVQIKFIADSTHPVLRRSIADETTKRDGGELYFGKLDGFNSTEFASSARGQVAVDCSACFLVEF